MNKKIPCEVIRDLFPSHIDGLTSPVTEELIEEHLKECEDCRKALAAMRSSSGTGEVPETDKKEIDFLKKNKKKNFRVLMTSLGGALALLLVCFLGGVFLIGQGRFGAWAPMHLEVEGKTISFEAVPYDSASAVSKLSYKEEDGVVTIEARSVLASPLHPGSLSGAYEAGEEIRQVRVGDRIVWADGASVSPLASDLYQTGHSYVGDMPANDRLTQALGIASFLGPFTSELETEKEPYGWKILLSEEIAGDTLKTKKQDMDAFGMIMTGLVENLDHVTFVYESGGKEKKRTVTAEDASLLLGQDVKNCLKDIRVLDELIRKTGLSLYAIPDAPMGERDQMTVRIKNMTDQEIYSYGCSYYKDGLLTSSGGGMNADNSAVKPGEMVWIPLSVMEFGGTIEEGSLLELELSFTPMAGEDMKVSDRVRIGYEGGSSCDLVLTGNAEEGYRIEK